VSVVGHAVGLVLGTSDGWSDVGDCDGTIEGVLDGESVVGDCEGATVGSSFVGISVGITVG